MSPVPAFIIIVSAVCASASAYSCATGSSKEGLPDGDVTSLIQTQSFLQRFDPLKTLPDTIPKRVHSGPPACSNLDRDFGFKILIALLNSAGHQASWDNGDWNFMTEDMCKRRLHRAKCAQTKEPEMCHGFCQWYPTIGKCDTLKILTIIDFAAAHPSSAFGVYSNSMKHCNGLASRKCRDSCMVNKTSTWAPCGVSGDRFDEVMCMDVWQSLVTRFKSCDSMSGKEEENIKTCRDNGCMYIHSNAKCQLQPEEFYHMGFGVPEGALLYKKSKEAWSTRRICRENGWRDACNVITKNKKTCRAKSKNQCKGNCDYRGKKKGTCEVTLKGIDSVCSSAEKEMGVKPLSMDEVE